MPSGSTEPCFALLPERHSPMITMKTCLLYLIALAAISISTGFVRAIEMAPNSDTLWIENFKPLDLAEDPYQGWKVTKGELHPSEDGAQLTITDGKEAQISRYMTSRTPNYPFLQVNVASLEAPGSGLLIGNSSTEGRIFGWAPPGISTFDLSGQAFYGNDSKENFRWALRISALARTGGSGTIRSIALVREPSEGLIVTRKNDSPATDPVQSGETLLVKLFTKEKLTKPPVVRFENLLESRDIKLIPGGGAVDLKAAGSGSYVAEIKLDQVELITPPVESLPNGRWTPTLRASVDVNGVIYSTCLPFTFDVSKKSVAAESATKDWQHEIGAPADAARRGWQEATRGTNLALGKPITFSTPPTYVPTHDEHDETNLTSGRLSSRTDDRIWFSKDSVGWFDLAGPVSMVLDLGEVKPVGKVAIRLLGGKEQAILSYPREIEVLVSDNGKDFRSVTTLTKLLESEKELADSTRYYIPEEGQAAVHAFGFELNVAARYVAWRITPESSYLVSDQIAVMAGDPSKSRDLASLPAAFPPLIMKGLAAFPRKGTLTVTTGIVTPNWFLFQDDLKARKPTDRVEFQFDLPVGVKLISGMSNQPVTKSESRPDGYRVFSIEPREVTRKGFKPLQGPFYFTADENAPQKSYARVRVAVNGAPGASVEVPLEIVAIEPVVPLRSQHVSLGWMNEKYALGWPDFFSNYMGLGFNAFPVFPRGYARNKEGSDWNDETKAILALVAQARERGLTIAYNESPFHTLEKIGPKVAPEAFNNLGGKPGKRLSPVYRGKYYRDEIQRVATNSDLVKPDIVFHDIELWHHSVEEGRNSQEMREAFRKSGKSEEDTLSDLGLEKMRDLREAINTTSLDRSPLVALYNNHAERPIYQYVFDWKKIYPETVDLAAPSLYVRGDCALIHQTMAANYKALGNKKTIPWLTAGTYGEFDPKLIEPQIYETILNGAWGLTYYCFHDFDPMDYYYQAQAFRTLGPYDSLIAAGDVIPVRSDGDEAGVSVYGTPQAALVLVGNYDNPEAISARVTCEGRAIAIGSDLQSGQPATLDAGSLTTDVPAFGYRLFHVEFSPQPVQAGT